VNRPAASEHVASYYAATANNTTRYPLLQGERRADVVIVGGGFTGVSAMLHLAERGYDVALLEANRIAWGASGRNGGQLIDGFVESHRIEKRLGADAARITYQMGIDSRQIVVDRISKYKIDCDLKFGYAELALRDSDIRDLSSWLEAKERANYPHEMKFLNRHELRTVVGSDCYLAALVNMGNGHLHPLNLCAGEAQAAVSLGATVFEQSPVVKIHHGHKPWVETASGSVHANKVLLAGNAYLGRSEPRLSGKVIPAGSYIMATEPLPPELQKELLPTDMACIDLRSALDYFRLSADGRMLWGGMCNYSGRVPKSVERALRPGMLKVFPQLKEARTDFTWGGNIAISLNRIPQFGRIEGNTYYVQGYSGHGVAPTHIAGKVLADIVAGESEQFELLSKIRHWRLPGGKWFANPALALGMLYYRLKEML
jgi:glycine/D-amino acid oxidase-like deaminating enzyme